MLVSFQLFLFSPDGANAFQRPGRICSVRNARFRAFFFLLPGPSRGRRCECHDGAIISEWCRGFALLIASHYRQLAVRVCASVIPGQNEPRDRHAVSRRKAHRSSLRTCAGRPSHWKINRRPPMRREQFWDDYGWPSTENRNLANDPSSRILSIVSAVVGAAVSDSRNNARSRSVAGDSGHNVTHGET